MSERPPRTPLLSPRRYFEHTDDPLAHGLAAFAVYFVGLSVLAYVTVRGVIERIPNPPSGVEQQLSSQLFVTATFSALFACIALLAIAAIMHFGCGGTSGDRAEFRDAVAVAAWAYAPNALSLPVSYLLVRRQLRQLSFETASSEALAAELQAVQTPSGLQIALSLAVVAWSVYILAYGTAETHDADLSGALVLASIVGVFAFIGSFL